MRRSFRVATVFTGAAACATTLAPAAQAAVVAPGATPRAPDTVRAFDCSNSTNSAFHLYYEPSQHHGAVCFTGTGSWFVGNGKKMFGYCAGGYSGSILVDGTWHGFTSGFHQLYGQSVEYVYLRGNPRPNNNCDGVVQG